MIITGRLVIAIVASWVLLTSPALALCGKMNGCGSEYAFASTYLAADSAGFSTKNGFSPKDIIRCRLRMLGSLMCVHNNGRRGNKAIVVVEKMLYHAKNAGDRQLRCAITYLRKNMPDGSLPVAKKHQSEALQSKDEQKALFSRFCTKEMLHNGVDNEIKMIGPGRNMLKHCMSGQYLTN